MANTKIQFPILRSLKVEGYGLFPGKDGKGLRHDFEPGVSVIAGINGIGKTTLLQIIFRLLVGPFNPSKLIDGLRLAETDLIDLRPFKYFSKRDRGTGAKAVASGEFSFGEKIIQIGRRLNTLDITSLKIDGSEINGDLEQRIWKASGCGSPYDFHVLVRGLLFFLEEKASVVWDPIAQVEIFRILFLDPVEAKQFSKNGKTIQTKDSTRRNLHAQLTSFRKAMPKQEAGFKVEEAVKEVGRLQFEYSRVEKILARLEERISSLELSRDRDQQKLDNLKLRREEKTRQVEYQHYRYFASLFPRLPDTVKNVLGNLIGASGCAVCGTRSPDLAEQFSELANLGACPICRSPKELHEELVTAAEFGVESLKQEHAQLNILKQEVDELEKSLAVMQDSYFKLRQEQVSTRQVLSKVALDLSHWQAALPADTEELREARDFIAVTEKQIKELDREIDEAKTEYEQQLQDFTGEVRKFTINISQYFQEYASNFLVEKCILDYAPSDLNVGQYVKLKFPTFGVQMTSAIYPDSVTLRKYETDVSESQKEFVDLAFRMALIKTYVTTAAKSQRASMLVIETPEASLDSIFIEKAGKMLRGYTEAANEDGTRNQVIASCNLNRENMISAILGTKESGGPSRAEVDRRVLNLLQECEANASLRENRAVYEEELAKAVGVAP